MHRKQPLDKELFTLSCYKSLRTAKYALLTELLPVSFYYLIKGYSTSPFYILLLLAILPAFTHTSFQTIYEPRFRLSRLKQQLGYSRRQRIRIRIDHFVSCLLLYVWWRRSKVTMDNMILKMIPLLLIIVPLLIITIGRYYYFHRFKGYLLSNQAEKIR